MTTREETAAWLDKQGITVTTAKDPVDGSDIAVVDLDQLAKLMKPEPEKVWLNAMKLVAPQPDFKQDVGGEIIRMVTASPRPEPDEFGIRPWRQITIQVTAS